MIANSTKSSINIEFYQLIDSESNIKIVRTLNRTKYPQDLALGLLQQNQSDLLNNQIILTFTTLIHNKPILFSKSYGVSIGFALEN